MPAERDETRDGLKQKAEHVRRVADRLTDGKAIESLLAYAEELEARAASMDEDQLR